MSATETRLSLHYDDGTKIDFNSEEDVIHHLAVQGTAGVEGLHEEASPEDMAVAHLEAQIKAIKGGEPATGDPYRADVEPATGKRVKTRKQLEAAVTAKQEADVLAEAEAAKGGGE